MLPTCDHCGLGIDYTPVHNDDKLYHHFCYIKLEKEQQMDTPKVSIIEKIAQNRKVIIKRTLQVAAGITGAVLITAFLAKERFPDESIAIEESEDGSFKVIDTDTDESYTVTKDENDEVQVSEVTSNES